MTDLYYPLHSLREGHWFKLICGASFQHLPAVRSLALAYTLAGIDCVDVAADPAVIAAAKEGLQAASHFSDIAQAKEFGFRGLPWLMVSLNDGEDPHFRKAHFSAANCPPDCSRPCERICPAQAIAFSDTSSSTVRTDGSGFSGVLDDRCYGCGRCLPVCPIQHITTRSYVSTPDAIAPLVLQLGVDAVEIHTQVGRLQDFERLWQAIAPYSHHLKLVAVSCPDGENLIEYLKSLYEVMSPLPCPLVWQTDGRPMSGDIGAGATRAAVRLGEKVLSAGLPGYVQLAGGTNHHTVEKLKGSGLLNPQRFEYPANSTYPHQPFSSRYTTSRYIAGIAYGSYARTLLSPVLEQLERLDPKQPTLDSADALHSQRGHTLHSSGGLALVPQPTTPVVLEAIPDLLWQSVDLAYSLVSQLKSP